MLGRRLVVAGLGALPAVAGAQPRKKIVVGFISPAARRDRPGQRSHRV